MVGLPILLQEYYAKIGNTEGFADLKRSYPYENLPVQTKMVILSRRPILVVIVLYKHFLHLTRIILHPDIPFLSARTACLSVRFDHLPV